MGNDYHNNDHIALAHDLSVIHRLGFKIISLSTLLDWYQGRLPDQEVAQSVVLTCDDGSWFDYYDIDHPHFGPQRSFFNIIKDYSHTTGDQVHLSSFVIVSPDGRIVLDQTCLAGNGWWTDDWWQEAQKSGLMSIENHSWDHNHIAFHQNVNHDQSFKTVDNQKQCDYQLRQSQTYLNKHMVLSSCYFAYPYGNFSDYLKNQYLPEQARDLGLEAAFTTEARAVTKDCQLWAMPRFVCGEAWHTSDEFERILLSFGSPKKGLF